jgi:hypothetical protein
MTANDVRRQLLELNQKIVDAERQARSSDIAFLASILSEGLLFRRADNSVVGKTEFLTNVPAAALRLENRQAANIEIAIRDKTALVTLVVTGTVEKDGAIVKKAFKNIRFFVQNANADWQLQHWYNEEVPT